MNNDITELLTNVYEIEGLLLVVSRHGKDTPAQVYKRIQNAANELNEQCKQLGEEQPAAQTQQLEQPAEPQPAPVTPPVFAPKPAEPQPVEPQQVPVEDREPDEDIDFEFIYEEDEPQEQPAPAAQHEPVVEPQPVPAVEPASAVEPEPVFEPEAEPVEEAPRRRDPSKDLRKFLALNDYYRFRRELFQGDEAAMNDALDRIQEMDTIDEVERYFLGTLEWDSQSEDVQYFLQIVNNRF